MPRLRLVLIAGVLIAPLAACSSGPDGAIAGHLSALPPLPDDQTQMLTYTDYDALAEQTGIERPGDDDDDEELLEWYAKVTGLGSESDPDTAALHPRAFHATYSRTFELEPLNGIDLREIESFVESVAGPGSFAGEFTDDTLDDELGSSDDGVWHDPDSQAGLALGSGASEAYLARVDDYLVVEQSEDVLRDRLDDGESAADDEALLAVADALDDQDVYAAQLIAWHGDIDTHGVAATGLGLAYDDGAVMTIVYGHDDEDEAEATLERAESFDANGDGPAPIDATRDGTVVVATLDPGDAQNVNQTWALTSVLHPVLFARGPS